MSKEYDEYLYEHIAHVNNAYDWLRKHLADVAAPYGGFSALLYLGQHDESKYSYEEYNAYDAYFYGEKPRKSRKISTMLGFTTFIRIRIIGSIGY